MTGSTGNWKEEDKERKWIVQGGDEELKKRARGR